MDHLDTQKQRLEREDEEEDTLELNTSWIDEYEQEHSLYADFYKDDVHHINLRTFYINRHNELDKLCSEPLLLATPNRILANDRIQILKRKTREDGREYVLDSVLQYNLTVQPEHVGDMIRGKEPSIHLLSTIETSDSGDIFFERTISMFQDLNDLILLYREVNPVSHTRRHPLRKTSHRHNFTRRKKIDIKE